MQAVTTPHAPGALGPYSQAVLHNGMLFVSGQLGIDYVTGDMPDDFAGQAELVFKNIRAILQAAGMSFTHVLKSTIFIKDLADFAVLNDVYAKQFCIPYPARETVQVTNLPKNAKIEISVIASK
jgi:2-iminobutanoate/2-iminopropanoate deaminase